MKKILFFFTSSYPFGSGETFIENEIDYLYSAFDKIIIVSNDTTNEQTREVPTNVLLYRKSYELSWIQKLLSLISITVPAFWKELLIIKKTYKRPFSLLIFNTMCQSWFKSMLWQPFIKRLIKNISQKEDNIFLYSYWNNDLALACAHHKKNNPRVIAFSRMHGWDVYFEANHSNYLPYRRFILQNLNRVFAVSDKGKQYYYNWFPELNLKISVARLGVKQNRKNQGNTTDKLQLLSISNIIPIKNLGILIEALAQLNIDFHWTHIGDGPLRTKLETRANEQIPGKYTFKGRLPNSEVLNHLQNEPTDLFINVSLSEGIPVSIMEAFSCGIPAVVTNVGGSAELVSHEINGFLIQNPKDTHAIGNAIIYYANKSVEEKVSFSCASYQTWKNHYNTEINYTLWIEKLLSL
jgi:glycosyltransferase involved in cell wall biosynthesis